MTEGDDLDRLLRGRRSIRTFRAMPVPTELIRRVVEAATWAPSAGNRQRWAFTVVVSEPVKRQMAESVRLRWGALVDQAETGSLEEELREYGRCFDWFSTAPVVIVVSARSPDEFMRHLLVDGAEAVSGLRASAAMAAQNLMLAAHARGLGTCCLTGPLAAHDELRRCVGLGHRHSIVCLVALGYPAEEPPEPPRKPIEDVMRVVE